MKKIMFILTLILCLCCKKEKNDLLDKTEVAKKETIGFQYDFSGVAKDTLLVYGKEIVFFVPSKEELNIIAIHNKDLLYQDSLYKEHIKQIKKYLKFPKAIKISQSSKRIIAVDDGNRIRYKDRLDDFKSNYGMLLMYNETSKFVKNYNEESTLFNEIDKFYRNNFRFEKTISHKYVIAQNGLNVRDEDGNKIGKYNYGEPVEIVGYTQDSVEIEGDEKWIKDVWAIIKWRQNGWTEKRYVFNGYLGGREDVKVFEDKICYGTTFENQQIYEVLDDAYPECLNTYFDFQLISKREYDSAPEISTDLYKENKAVIITKNEDETTNVSLPLKDSTLIYNSKIDYNESSHTFYGDVSFLNQYLMFHVYYKAEEAFYAFVDKTTGKETLMLNGFPNISPNKDRIVAFHYDVYENKSYLQIFKINPDKTINFEKGFQFMFWAENATNKLKWISNNEFLMTISFVDEKGRGGYKTQYLKVKLKF
ncbi:hypothetical protein [Winogradskyella sp.]|uniref:hypothetical protein n=1 Tax=Winogradskyella sp. TaxID=1883156 RepID=UPI0025D32D0E|nr:hypothetical protein [Winogradskyella sp.]MCT4628660.1 hypothetical protein [Winogradskyella sp.]